MLAAGVLLLIFHFIAVFVYANPFGKPGSKVSYAAYAYVYPYFHQNWNLFAPAPEANYRLIAEYENGGLQRRDVFAEIVQKHQANRLLGYEPLVIAFSNSMHYFEKNSPLQQALNGPVKDDFNFTILERAVKNYLKYNNKTADRPLRLILVVENTQSKEQRVYFN